jgi:catechol 2,3-dioxygenase-like lactoylglutathione lyase family enzyme
MPVEVDHMLVEARDRAAAARQLGELLGVPWEAQGAVGPFSPVFVNAGLTIDFTQVEPDQAVQPTHVAFRVSEAEFEAILARIQAAGIEWRSGPAPVVDRKINTSYGGRLVYWDQPDGHVWEILTVSYARR